MITHICPKCTKTAFRSQHTYITTCHECGFRYTDSTDEEHTPSIPEILLQHGFVEEKWSYIFGEHEIYESAVGWCYSFLADDNFGVAPLPNLIPDNLPTLLHILGIQ